MKNKKGIFFTLTAIFLISLLFFSYSIYSVSKEHESITGRVKTLNGYVFSLKEDVERKLFISGFRIIFLHEKRIIEDGVYFSDIISSFNETFFNGTILGEIREGEEALIEGITYGEILSEVNSQASKLNLIVSFNNSNFLIDQVDPWNVRVRLSSDLLIRDRSNLASWNRSEEFSVLIPISNFEDPVYIINTLGRVNIKFVKSNYTFGPGVSNLTSHIEGKYYISNTEAPSFLKRFQGDLSSDENGVESLVYLPDLSGQGISLKDKSVVDHVYFSNENPSASAIGGMPSWFKLDNDHLSVYGV